MKSIAVFSSSLILATVGATFAQDETNPVERKAVEAFPRPDPVEPPSPEAIEKAIDDGVSYLLRAQNPNGSWGSARNTKGLNIYAPIPGAHHAFRSAVTAMAITALIETGSLEGSKEVAPALRRGEDWLLENLPGVRRATGDAIYNNWAHAYGCQALARMLQRAPNDGREARIRNVIATQLKRLESYESIDGGWGYYDFRAQTKQPSSSSISFMTATVLIALHDLKEGGIEVPVELVERGIAAINRQRKPDNSYAYGEYLKLRPMRGINRPAGSLGRSQACNLALRVVGRRDHHRRRDAHLARPVVGAQWLAGYRQKTPRPSRSLVSSCRLLLLLRPLLCGTRNREPATGLGTTSQASAGNDSSAETGEGRHVVGLPALRLPSAIRHSVRAHVPGPLPRRSPATLKFTSS